MLTREAIREVERMVNANHQRIDDALVERNRSLEARKAWEDAVLAWNSQENEADRLWSDAFRADLRASERGAIDEAILFLEVDPWYFRSGYLKERLIRGLKHADLGERDRRRLRNVVWNVAAGRNRREFRDFCALAAVVCDADLLRQLEAVSPERDQAARGKFGQLLRFLRKHAVD